MMWQILQYQFQSLPKRLRFALCLSVGAAIGMFLIVVRVSNAVSYLSDAPETCMNCHVMTDAYATWKRGSHARVAVCMDCHVPHNNVASKYAFKGIDGLKHSYVFTTRQEPQVMELSNGARPVVQANCIRCHKDQFSMIRLAASSEQSCWRCHQNIHGQVHSLSASPEVLRPGLPDAGLKWMKKGDSHE